MRKYMGFTLIELVVVIVLLGILGAVAVPKFVDLSDEADTAALTSTVGAVESASAMNYAASVTNSPDAQAIAGGADCTVVISADATGGILAADLDAAYTVTGTISATAVAGDESDDCQINGSPVTIMVTD